jgi:hypothetical protein
MLTMIDREPIRRASRAACPASPAVRCGSSARRGLVAGGAAVFVAICMTGVAAEPTTLDGAFTAGQAERGRLVYEAFCINCHELEFYQTKLAVWQNASVGELFEALSVTMPSENPGGLLSEEYLDVLAYIFSITGSPIGADELTLDSMDLITIVTEPQKAGP